MVLVTLCKSADRGRRLSGIDSLAETAKQNPDYEKNRDCFDVLKPLQATAIQRAKTRAKSNSEPRHRADFTAEQSSDNRLGTCGVFKLQDLNCINLKI